LQFLNVTQESKVETPAVNVGVLFCFVLRVLQEPYGQAMGISPRCFLRIHHIEKMKNEKSGLSP